MTVAVLALAGSLAVTAPNYSAAGPEQVAPPATQPTVIRAVPNPAALAVPAALASLPEPWTTLIRRSIFARGGQPAPVPGSAPNGAAAGDPDGRIALRGVVLEDNAQYSAFLEDTAGNRTMRVRPGDPVGMGRVKAINLDSLVFETPLRTTQVQVGQNLLGAPVPPPQPAAAPAGPPNGPPPAGPQGPPGLPPGVSPEMAKQMMAREARKIERLQAEQNGERRGRP